MNAKTKQILLIIADVLLYLVGFPLLVVLGYLSSREFIAQGIYGFMAYLPVILPALMMVICGIVEIAFRASSKRTFAEGRKHRSNVKKQTMKLVIAVVACLCLFSIVLDIALPSVLKEATQGTILYEDIVEDYAAQNIVQRKLVDSFIELNVENGYLTDKTYKVIDDAVADETLSDMSADEYKALFETMSKEFRGGTYMYPEAISLVSAWDTPQFEAIKDKKAEVIAAYKKSALADPEIKKLSKSLFLSIDAAYAAFDPLLIEMAQEDMSLVMSSTDLLGKVVVGFVSDGQIRTKIVNGKKLTAVDADLAPADAESLKAKDLDPEDEFLFKWSIMDMLGEVPADLLSIDLVLTIFGIDPENPETNNARRGTLDYMSMAWLDSVSLLGIISLFAMRTWFYIFAAVIALLTLLRGLVRKSYKNIASEPVAEVGEFPEDEDENIYSDETADVAIAEEKPVKQKKVKVKKEKKVKTKKGEEVVVDADIYDENDDTAY